MISCDLVSTVIPRSFHWEHLLLPSHSTLLEWRPGGFSSYTMAHDSNRMSSAMESPPGIAALFVIRFDIRTG